ncbi:MAG: L-histidine N(alpha)-methyltransferase [Vicinamibacterales bacterium]
MRPANARVRVHESAPEAATAQLAADVRFYLERRPRQLPSRHLYDPLGSALFDAICHLPWYRVTAGETRLLTSHAAEILGALRPLARVVELGSGNGDKLAALVSSGPARSAPLDLHLVDISRAALETAARALSAFDHVRVVAHEATYEAGLRDVTGSLAGDGRTLALFLGSNIGNYDPPGAAALLRQVRGALGAGDGFLLGADLVKPEADLLRAYDDPLGVTAAFNRNLLVRLNRELDADFDLPSFRHRAVWNAEASRVEMHLVSARPQRVRIRRAGLDLTLRDGETIWTESSYKYEPQAIVSQLEAAGFRLHAQWIDEASRFALTLVDVPGA